MRDDSRDENESSKGVRDDLASQCVEMRWRRRMVGRKKERRGKKMVRKAVPQKVISRRRLFVSIERFSGQDSMDVFRT